MTTTKPHPESTVLAPCDPSLTNTDDWPEFVLNDAVVTLPNKQIGAPISLLQASEHYPVSVTGRLEPLRKDLSHLLLLPPENSKRATIDIEISEVLSFAYASYPDGGVEVWAAGKAGWFVIRPSRAYRPTYNAMIEAVKLLYFIADAYKTPRTNGKGKNATTLPDYNAQELFEKYAVEVMGIPKAAPEAAQKMYKHRDFLLSSMVEGKEGMAWGKNPLYTHLCRKFPGDVASIRRRLAGFVVAPAPIKGAEKAKVAAPAVKHGRHTSLDSVSTTSSLKRKRGRPRKNPGADVISIGSSSVASSIIKEAPPKAGFQPTDRTKTRQQPAKPAPTAAASRRTRKDLKASAPASVAETPEIPATASATPVARDSDSDSTAPRRAHKGKSALRLKPSKATKGPPRRGKTPAAEDDDEESELSDPPTSPAPTKRKRGEEAPGKPSKLRSSKQNEAVDEGISMADSPDSATGSGSDEIPATPTSQPDELAHRLDPVQEDTWLCALDGCTHKVYAASSASSQALIREHYALHAYDDDERVKMVKRLQAPSLPVRHLMEKVRIRARVEGFPGSKVAGTRFPEAGTVMALPVAVRAKY